MDSFEFDNHRWAHLYPELGTGPVPIHTYVSPEHYAVEIERVFRKAWLLVGRVDEIPNAGDYKVKRLDVVKASIILMRAKDGSVNVFHNVCSHRANKMISETGNETFGTARAALLACDFHGWIYDAHGNLTGVPQEARFYSCFSKENAGLTNVHFGIWEGFVFVNLAAEPPTTLEEYLGDCGRHLAGYPFADMDCQFTYSAELRCNWKVGLDAFSEAYHLGMLHGRSLPGSFSNSQEEVQLFGDHQTTALYLGAAPRFTPTAALANSLATASLMASHAASMLPPQINPHRRPEFGFEMTGVFPNTLIHVTEGIWFTHQFWPLAHDKTLWQGKYYVAQPKTNSQLWATLHAQTITRNIWLEDTGTMEQTQEGLESGAKPELLFQDDEVFLRHNFNVLQKYTAVD